MNEASSINRSLWPVLGLAVLAALYVLHAVHFIHYVNDDAYITFRFSQFLAEGNGPYFNPGERVEGYTNFSMMLIVAAAIKLFGPGAALVTAQATGLISGIAALGFSFLITRRLLLRFMQDNLQAGLAALVTPTLIMVHPAYALNSMSGLETVLYSALLTAGVWMGLRSFDCKRWTGSGFCFAALLLTRPEGAYLFAFAWLGQALAALVQTLRTPENRTSVQQLITSLWANYRYLVLDGLIVTLTFGVQILLRMKYYDGEWLPNTYYAKGGGYWHEKAGEYVYGAFGTAFLFLPGVLLMAAGWITRRSIFPALLCIIVPALAGVTIPWVTGTDWMVGYRLLIPYLPLAAVCVSLGWIPLAARLPLKTTGWIPLIAVTGIALFLLHSSDRKSLFNETRIRADGYVRAHEEVAALIKKQEPDESPPIALMDIGIISFRCIDHMIIDITGLTDRHIAKSPGPFLKKEYDPVYIFEKNPKYIVLAYFAYGDYRELPPEGTHFRPWSKQEQKIYEHPMFQQRYLRDDSSPTPQNSWLDHLASILKAEKMFLHDHPKGYYLLAVFKRQDNL